MAVFHRSFLYSIILFLTTLIALPLKSAEDMVLGRKKSEWLEMLKGDKDGKRRRAAVIALGIIGPTADDVDKALAEALANDTSDQVRSQVLTVISGMRKPDLSRWALRLGNVLKYEKNDGVRAQAAIVLGKMEELAKPVLSNIIESCKDKDASTRAAAVDALGRIGSEAKVAVPDIIALLKDKESSVRINAIFAIGRLSAFSGDAIPELVQLLQTETEVDIRKEIVRVLGMFGPNANRSLTALIKILKEDKSDDLRQQVVITLGRIGSSAVSELDTLKACLQNDKDKTVRVYLVRTISNLLGSNSSSVVKEFADQLAKDKDTDVKLALIQELSAMGENAKPALPALKAASEDVSVIVRKEAKAAIEKININPKK